MFLARGFARGLHASRARFRARIRMFLARGLDVSRAVSRDKCNSARGLAFSQSFARIREITTIRRGYPECDSVVWFQAVNEALACGW